MGGPDQNDNYQDKRDDYVSNEVTCDYNAGFQSAVAALRQLASCGNSTNPGGSTAAPTGSTTVPTNGGATTDSGSF